MFLEIVEMLRHRWFADRHLRRTAYIIALPLDLATTTLADFRQSRALDRMEVLGDLFLQVEEEQRREQQWKELSARWAHMHLPIKRQGSTLLGRDAYLLENVSGLRDEIMRDEMVLLHLSRSDASAVLKNKAHELHQQITTFEKRLSQWEECERAWSRVHAPMTSGINNASEEFQDAAALFRTTMREYERK